MAFLDFLRSLTPYKCYVLLLCLLAYLLNQLDRYLLPVMSKHIAHDIHYGDMGCLDRDGYFNSSITDDKYCSHISTKSACESGFYFGGNESVCEWDYTGQGIEYQLIAGPVFIVVYTLCGIFIGYLTSIFKKKNLLAFFLLVWSVFTALSGTCNTYWQLALTRFGLGIGEAGCTPFAAVIIAEMFDTELRGSAMGIYNFGIYFGYSMSYAFGNFLYDANIMDEGWRWVFYISSMMALPVAALLFITVKESPPSSSTPVSNDDDEDDCPLLEEDPQPTQPSWSEKLKELFFAFLSPPLLMLCLAGSIRNAGGYTWAVNTQLFFESQHQTSEQIGSYMSWIPLVGGSVGAFFGGFISDRVVKRRGIPARMAVLMISQICAAPFALMALLLPAPACYIMLLPSNIIGEMWIGVCLTCVLELVPEKLRGASVGYYLFIITNIGGNIPLLLPPLKTLFAHVGADVALRNALIILFPGMYLASSVLFLLTIFIYKVWNNRQSRLRSNTSTDTNV
ncbi:hypothetical protein EB796_018320 [Bugula neritina]|uniref:Major facilitator superfamily (MFS) profile domain-containing protein n=1 Tax=Bugula neritina TaxID=10212 RepID=A0A7J7JBP8_BUGNE|nr:hypothetical protein EB796_018320 [Bugula neritina]